MYHKSASVELFVPGLIKSPFPPPCWNDNDGAAIGAIETILNKYPEQIIIFANGGDRTKENIPEINI